MPVSFLDLPRELRDVIYELYFTKEGGYVYDASTKNFTDVDGQPVDLALTRTCKQVASETHGLELKYNSLTFKPWCPDTLEERQQLAYFPSLLKGLNGYHAEFVAASRFKMPVQLDPEILEKYPLFKRFPFFDWEHGEADWDGESEFRISTGGEVLSTCLAFVDAAFEFMAKQPGFAEMIAERRPISKDENNTDGNQVDYNTHDSWWKEFLEFNPKPWDILSKKDMDKLWRISDRQPYDPKKHKFDEIEHSKTNYRYSAAAVAIRYLKNICCSEKRCHIRHIKLIEDQIALAKPESHVQGLIPFCQENTNLRIMRHADLWKNVHPDITMRNRGLSPMTENIAIVGDIIDGLAKWIMEARALAFHGMPAESFTLFLEDSVDPELSSASFRFVDGEIWFQKGLSHRYNGRPNLVPEFKERKTLRFPYREFPLAVEEMVAGKSVVRYNFDIWRLSEQGRDNYERLASTDFTFSKTEFTAPLMETPWPTIPMKDVFKDSS